MSGGSQAIVVFMLIIVSVISCNSKKSLQSYFESEFNIKIPDYVHTLIVLDDTGCKGCNSGFSHWIRKNTLNHDKIWVVVTATGAHMDISPYLNAKYKNVFVEQNTGRFKELQLCGSSGFMFLKEGKVQKTYCVSPQELENHLKILQERLTL